MANHVSKVIHMKDDKMQKWQTMCPTDTYKKKDANEMTCQFTHIINITCLTLLSWPMVTTIAKYVKYTHFKTHIWLHIVHMHPHPPKVFIQACKKHTKGKKENSGAQMNEEMSTQNIDQKKDEGICSIRTIGNTQSGGGT